MGISLAKAMKLFVGDVLWFIPAFFAAHMFFQWVGNLYLDAKMQSQSNEGLLNNMKEGLFIVSKEDYSV